MLWAERAQRWAARADEVQTIWRSKADADLDARLAELRSARGQTASSRAELVPEALGIVAELARRTLAEEPIAYKCQLVTAIHLLEGRIVELPNGEGKTLACALAAAFTAFLGKPCHIATHNSYLARRDLTWMGPLYLRLGLKPVAFLEEGALGVLDEHAAPLPPQDGPVADANGDAGIRPQGADDAIDVESTDYEEIRGRWYRLRVRPGAARDTRERALREANVVYGTITAFIFRHLEDNLVVDREAVAFRQLACLIVDECDFALIDSADQIHTQVTASFDFAEMRRRDLVRLLFGELTRLHRGTDYDPLDRCRLTPSGERRIREAFGWGPLLSEEYCGVASLVDAMLWGLHGLRRDVHYVVSNGEILPLDLATGRPRAGARFELGTHEALVLAHGLDDSRHHSTTPQGEISVHHFVRAYAHVCGLTASAIWYAREFRDLYGLTVVAVRPRFTSRRRDQDDVVFRTRYGKFVYLIDLVVAAHATGQPVLVDCPDIRTAELIWAALSAQDEDAFASAHEAFMRFADEQAEHLGLRAAHLGLDRGQVAEQFARLAATPPRPQLLTAKHLALEAAIVARAGARGAVTISAKLAGRGTDIRVGEESDARGGLLVIGFDRNPFRHIDQQVRGRTARQGRPGTSVFLVSLQDEVLASAANPRLTAMMDRLGMGVEQGDELKGRLLNRGVEAAQRRATLLAARERYRVFRLDAVMDRHRRYLTRYRRGILEGRELDADLAQMVRNIIVRNVGAHLTERDRSPGARADALVESFLGLGPFSRNELLACIDEDGLNRTIAKFGEVLLGRLQNGVRQSGAARFSDHLRPNLLYALNAMWSRYLSQKRETYSSLSTAGALHLQPGIPLEQYQLELDSAYWREIATLEQQTVADAYGAFAAIAAGGTAETGGTSSAPPVEDASRPRETAAQDRWVRFRPLGIRAVSVEMLRGMASEVVAARDFAPVLGAWLAVVVASLIPAATWDTQRLAHLVPLRSDAAALLGFAFGPAIFYGGMLLLGAFPLLAFSGLRAFVSQPLRPPALAFGAVYAAAVAIALHGLQVGLGAGVLAYVVACAVLQLCGNLFDPLRTVPIRLFGFLIQAAPITVVLLALSWLAPSWLPLLGTACVIGIGLYTAYRLHGVLAMLRNVSLWRVQMLLLALVAFFEVFRGEGVVNGVAVLAVVGTLMIGYRRIAAPRVFVDVVDLSGSRPRSARHAIQLPHKAIYLLAAAATVVLAIVLSACVLLLGRLDVFPSAIDWAAGFVWPMAAVMVGAYFLVHQRMILWVNRLLSGRLLLELQRRYTILSDRDGQLDATDRLARAFLSRIREVVFLALCAFLLVWAATLVVPRMGGETLRVPLGIGGFVIVCGLFGDALFSLVRRFVGRIQIRNAEQALMGARASGVTPLEVQPFSSELLERQRAVLEDFWNATRTDKLLFLKQIIQLARKLGTLPALELKPVDVAVSVVVRFLLLTIATGVAYQLSQLLPVSAEAIRPWFWVVLAAGLPVIALLSVLEYRAIRRETGAGTPDADHAAFHPGLPGGAAPWRDLFGGAKLAPGEPQAPTGRSIMTGLLKVSGCDDPERVADVVFVHGLDGDAGSTWQSGEEPRGFWPAWLGSEFPAVGVWSLGYAVSSTAWKGRSMPLADRAANVLDVLELDGIGRRPVLFVCHSLGGLLVKQVLRHAADARDPRWRAVAEHTRAIVFLSTPHSGSDLASWLRYVSTVLRSTVSVKELEAHDSRLRELNHWYRDHATDWGIKTFVYCEKLPTRGVLVVNETTADPGIPGVRPIPLDEDHVSICRPASKDHQVYRRVRQLIAEHLLADARQVAAIRTPGAAVRHAEVSGTVAAAAVGMTGGFARPERPGAGTHVFLSYCRENAAQVAQLRQDLLAAGEAVWWDQDILPGQDWRFEIRRAMKHASVVVLCLSREAEARTRSGIYPEALDAIAALREHAPGSIFLIPVRLSECELPMVEIDATRTLDRLHYVDLFPPERRADGVAKLIAAIRASPLHG